MVPLRNLGAVENLPGYFAMGGRSLGKCPTKGQIQLPDEMKWIQILPGKLENCLQLCVFPPDFITCCNEEPAIILLKLLSPKNVDQGMPYA